MKCSKILTRPYQKWIKTLNQKLLKTELKIKAKSFFKAWTELDNYKINKSKLSPEKTDQVVEQVKLLIDAFEKSTKVLIVYYDYTKYLEKQLTKLRKNKSMESQNG